MCSPKLLMREAMDPPGTYSRKMFRCSSVLVVPCTAAWGLHVSPVYKESHSAAEHQAQPGIKLWQSMHQRVLECTRCQVGASGEIRFEE